jgi:hypothetical protein
LWLSWAGSAPLGPVNSQELKKGATRLRQSTDKAIVGLFGGSIFETGQFLYRKDNLYMLLEAEPSRAEAFLDALV